MSESAPEDAARGDGLPGAGILFELLPLPAVLVGGRELRVAAANAAGRQLLRVAPGARLEDAVDGDGVPELLRTLQALQARDEAPAASVLPLRRVLEPDARWSCTRVRADAGEDGPGFLCVATVADPDGGAVRAVEPPPAGQPVPPRQAVRRGAARAVNPVELLQDALLPAELPVLPGLDVSARYLFAEAKTSAGGDWYDVVPLPDGTVALVVGDVVGHGVAAPAVMGQLRAVLEERLRSGVGIEAALTALDRYAALRHEAWAATVCVVGLDPATGEMAYCTAGHPPPLVAGTSGGTAYLPLSGAGPLVSGAGFPVAAHRLGPDDVLVLYSDGIVQRPGLTPAENAAELAEAIGGAVTAEDPPDDHGPPITERACQAPLERLTTGSGHADDITLLAARRTAVPLPLSLSLPAVPASIRVARGTLGGWLKELRVQPLEEMALQHALTELVCNAVEHAYAGRPADAVGRVEVSAGLRPDGRVQLAVTDTGRWRPPPEDGRRGRGLAMTEGFVDSLMLTPGPSGTTVVVRHRVSRPALLLTGPTPDAVPVRPPSFSVTPTRDGVLEVSGVVDATTVDELRVALLQATQGGARRPTVDLSGVTLLCSVGVQLLIEHRARHPASRLVAPVGSSAHQVLDLVGLEHSTHG